MPCEFSEVILSFHALVINESVVNKERTSHGNSGTVHSKYNAVAQSFDFASGARNFVPRLKPEL